MEKHFVIVTPCFNEEKVVRLFLESLEKTLGETGARFTVVAVDDGSLDSTKEILQHFTFKSDTFSLKPISLLSNMGHQEAIRQGLMYAQKLVELSTRGGGGISGVIVMDSDGEDDPAAIRNLIDLIGFDIVFVSRGKRTEGLGFKLGYYLYKLLFKIVIGKSITFGNYSLISPRVLKAVSRGNFMHYPAFLSKLRFPIRTIIFDRKRRIDGKSKMSYKGLVFHGLRSLVEYSEEMLYFMMKVFVGFVFILAGVAGYVFYDKFIAKSAVLGWAGMMVTGLVIIMLVILTGVISGLLLLSIKKMVTQNTEAFEELK